MKKLPVFFAFIALCACNSTTTHTDVATAAATDNSTLAASDIYTTDKVVAFLSLHPQADAEAGTLLDNGISKLRKENNADAARKLLLQSIIKHPSAAAYYEMGNACMNALAYADATLAYTMAEKLGYEPHAKVLYNIACAYSRNGKVPEAQKYLEYAIEAGYNNKDQIMKDADLAEARKDYSFTTTYSAALSGRENPADLKWNEYLQGYKPVKYPLVLNEESGKRFSGREEGTETQYISYDYDRFVPEMKDQPRFSREVGKEFFYVGKVGGNDKYVAVVYAILNSMQGDGAPMAYTITTYNHKGIIIDHLSAGQPEIKDPYRVVTITSGGTIEAKDYRQTWEKDPAENGYYENKLVSSALVRTAQYHFAQDGRIVRDNAMLGMR